MSSKADALSSTILRSVLSFPNKGCSLACAGNEHEINYPSVTFCKNRELNAEHKEFIRKHRELCYSGQKYSNSDLTARTMLFSLCLILKPWKHHASLSIEAVVQGASQERIWCLLQFFVLWVWPESSAAFVSPLGSSFSHRTRSPWAWGVPGDSQSWGEAGHGAADTEEETVDQN